MPSLSRRTFLGTVAAGVAGSVAGCNDQSDGGDGSGGNSLPAYADWIPASQTEETDQFQTFHLDIPRFQSEFPSDALDDIDIEGLATDLGLEVDDLDGMLVVQTGPLTEQVVVTGSIDTETVLDTVAEDTETTSYGDFEVVQDQIAVGEAGIVIGTAYEALVDAHQGDVDRLYDLDGEWDPALRNVSGGTLTGVSMAPEEEYELIGISMNAGNGDTMALSGYAHFASADAAEDGSEAVESSLEEDTGDNQFELQDFHVDGNVVVVEGEAEDYQF